MINKPHFAVMGNPISHSLSPIIHQHFAKETGITLTYQKILAHSETFVSQVQDFFHQGGQGLNITAPFKEAAFKLAKHPTQRCSQAGSANTLWMKDSELYADNTDGVGLIQDLSKQVCLQGLSILILGAGGATRGILHPLLESKPSRLIVANRTLDKARTLQTIFPTIQISDYNNLQGSFDVIIHATSARCLSDLPKFDTHIFQTKPFCYDLNYDLEKPTPFLQLAQQQGCKAQDGLGMLIAQAALAFKIWHGVNPYQTLSREVYCHTQTPSAGEGTSLRA